MSRQARAKNRWKAPDLKGSIAVVMGASRGVGGGIASVLGECETILRETLP